jgi:3-oxoacyl-[acyl-carrier-protein] synthase II
VNAHGTGTPLGDPAEARAIAAVFGDHARRVAVSSTKSMTGHLTGAAGAMEAVASILTLTREIAPPTINLTALDPEVTLDCIPNHARALRTDAVMSNAFGFGGTNACLVFARHG